MQSIFSSVVVISIALATSGCASPAKVQSMVTPVETPISAIEDSELKNNLQVERVYGGKETNPLWASQVSSNGFRLALERSLEAHSLSSKSNPSPKFEVHANLKSLDQPLFGLDMTVNSRVGYEVIEIKSRKAWFEKDIMASFTATFSDAAIGVERLRIANEGSIRENIGQFIRELLSAPFGQARK